MSTNYDGDGSSTQSPSATPASGASPTVVLPADGDPASAASVAQALKVLADYADFHQRPFANALGVYSQEIVSYRSGILHRVFGVDHLGLPAGRIMTREEHWMESTAGESAAGSGTWVHPWKYFINGTGANFQAQGALVGLPSGTLMKHELFDNSSGAKVILESELPWIVGNVVSSWDFDFMVAASSGPAADTGYAIGMGDGTMSSGTLDPVGALIFTEGVVGTAWSSYVKIPAGSPVTGSLGITLALNAIHRARIDVIPAGESDDAVARVIFYIDGAVAANVTADLTTASLYPFIKVIGGASVRTQLYTGPLRMRARLATGDVFL